MTPTRARFPGVGIRRSRGGRQARNAGALTSGSLLGARLGQRYPDLVAGIHVTIVYGSIEAGDPPPTEAERAYFAGGARWERLMPARHRFSRSACLPGRLDARRASYPGVRVRSMLGRYRIPRLGRTDS